MLKLISKASLCPQSLQINWSVYETFKWLFKYCDVILIIFWVDKSWLKMAKTWWKCQNWKIQMRHFKSFSNNVFLLEISTIPFSYFWISGLFHVIWILITISPQAMIMIDWQMWWQQHLLCTWSNKKCNKVQKLPSSRFGKRPKNFWSHWIFIRTLFAMASCVEPWLYRFTTRLIHNFSNHVFFLSTCRNGSSDIVFNH